MAIDDRQLKLDWQVGTQEKSSRNAERSFLALGAVKGLGIQTIKSLLGRYQNLTNLKEIGHSEADELSVMLRRRRVKNVNRVIHDIKNEQDRLFRQADIQIEDFRKSGIEILVDDGHSPFPKGLRDMDDPPKWLFIQGNTNLVLSNRLVAVVGTRRPSPTGRECARQITDELGQLNYVIISGLANGIDDVAHRTALDSGTPTIGVLGSGIRVIFPAATRNTRQRILDSNGAIVTEYFPQDSYSRDRFLKRNRIQAAISIATVPLEGEMISGTSGTYRFALKLGRTVFGVWKGLTAEISGENQILTDMQLKGLPVIDLDKHSPRHQLQKILAYRSTSEPKHGR